jgi:hypothetical protein
VRGVVLRGDLLRLRRRGDRVWIRVRPFEIFWRTTDSFAVEDIRLIEIRPLVRERRRRSAMGRTRQSEAAVTRLTIQDRNQKVAIQLNETPASIAEVFADLADRLAAEGGWRQYQSPGLCPPQASDEPSPIDASPAPAPETNTDLQRELFSLRDSGDRVASEPVGEDLFSVGPPKIQWRHEDSDDDPAAASRSMSDGDPVLFPYEEPTIAAGHGHWIRKRKSTRRFFG